MTKNEHLNGAMTSDMHLSFRIFLSPSLSVTVCLCILCVFLCFSMFHCISQHCFLFSWSFLFLSKFLRVSLPFSVFLNIALHFYKVSVFLHFSELICISWCFYAFLSVSLFYFYYTNGEHLYFFLRIIKKKNMREFIKLNITIKAVYIINICV